MRLVSPTDRDLLAEFELRKLSAMSHSLPEKFGADVLIVLENGRIAVQRKFFPNDFIASLEDGRIAREVMLLKLAEYPIFLIEGYPLFAADGHLMSRFASRWTKKGLRNAIRTIWFSQGIMFERTENIQDTVDVILEIESYISKGEHRSCETRPKAVKDTWGKADKRDFARFFLQGIPGIGPVIAEQIYDHFGKIPMEWTCTEQELCDIKGVGPKRAKILADMLK